MAKLKVPCSLIIERGEQFLEQRRANIEANRERLIDRKMQERFFWLFGRKLTRKEAIRRIENQGNWVSPFDELEFHGAYAAAHIQKLIALAKMDPDGSMYITEKDAAAGGFLNPPE